MATATLNFPNIAKPAFPMPSTREDGSIRTKYEDGTPVARNRYTRRRRIWDGVRWAVMSDADWATLDAFWNNDTGGGVLWFNWTHPYTDEALVVQFTGPIKEVHNAPNQHEVTISIQEV